MKEKKTKDITFDDIQDTITRIPVGNNVVEEKPTKKTNVGHTDTINCLVNEKVIVRYLKRKNGIWGDNPKHVLAGGLAENATITFTVPRLTSGTYVNVLTNAEKEFFEEYLGLEYNALSVHNKNNNFWDCTNAEGINKVSLTKGDNILDLSTPTDYIKYKILLANKNMICSSLRDLQDYPKATYRFVIIRSNDEAKQQRMEMTATMRCYKEFGKIEDDIDTLRVILEIMDGRPVATNTKLEFLQVQMNKLIQKDSKMFLSIITDPLLQTKVTIKKAVLAGTVSVRGNYYYLKSDGSPLCSDSEEPTLNIAAKYLSEPKHQDLLFSLQAKIQ